MPMRRAGEAIDHHDDPIDRLELHGSACLGWRGVLVMVFDLFDQEPPGLVLARAGGLFDRDLEVAQLALDLLARQHVQAARQDRRLDHRALRAVEAFERRVTRLMHYAAMKARALLVLLHMV